MHLICKSILMACVKIYQNSIKIR